jgi:DNA polymerase (family X)
MSPSACRRASRWRTGYARSMDRLTIARALREIGLLLELQGGNPFKARAYERGARALEALGADLEPLVAQGRLTELPGVGSALAATIRELHLTGKSEQLDKLRDALPPGVLELSQVPGLSVPRIAALHQALGIASVEELRSALEAGRVQSVPGFGAKTEAKYLAALKQRETHAEQMLLHRATLEGHALLAHVQSGAGVMHAALAGALRRRAETVDRLVVAVSSDDPARALTHTAAYPPALQPVARTDERVTFRIARGLLVEAEAVAPSAFPALLHALTGAEGHRARLAARAREFGFTLDRAGLARAKGGRWLPIKSEADLYRHLGLPYLPPEVREETVDLETAAMRCETGLVEASDIQGMVHCHSTYSDGADTIEAMARAARAMGMRYMTLTDHSPTASYAGGLTVERLRRQWDEIAEAQERVQGLTILRGTECDILANGQLDYPDEILEQLDVVIASIHNRHRMDERQMTHRLVRAMRHPCFKIWGHALGRYVLRRPPIACRMEEVLDAAAESRVAIEVNGNPHRLDMEPRWQREALRRGLRFVVSTDAHSTAELQHLCYGLDMARRGLLTARDVLNTLPVHEFRRAVRPAGA